jgi:hypothetical protein
MHHAAPSVLATGRYRPRARPLCPSPGPVIGAPRTDIIADICGTGIQMFPSSDVQITSNNLNHGRKPWSRMAIPPIRNWRSYVQNSALHPPSPSPRPDGCLPSLTGSARFSLLECIIEKFCSTTLSRHVAQYPFRLCLYCYKTLIGASGSRAAKNKFNTDNSFFFQGNAAQVYSSTIQLYKISYLAEQNLYVP